MQSIVIDHPSPHESYGQIVVPCDTHLQVVCIEGYCKKDFWPDFPPVGHRPTEHVRATYNNNTLSRCNNPTGTTIIILFLGFFFLVLFIASEITIKHDIAQTRTTSRYYRNTLSCAPPRGDSIFLSPLPHRPCPDGGASTTALCDYNTDRSNRSNAVTRARVRELVVYPYLTC